jgi:hypothetical protein
MIRRCRRLPAVYSSAQIIKFSKEKICANPYTLRIKIFPYFHIRDLFQSSRLISDSESYILFSNNQPSRRSNMRRILYPLFLVLLLSACIGMKPIPVPAPTRTLTPTPALVQGINPTIWPITDFPPLTPVPLSLILTDFPLAVGATWQYSAEISYEDPNDPTKALTWTGIVVDRVMDKRIETNESLVFTVQEDMDPRPPEGVWRQPLTFEYRVSGYGVFKNTLKVYQYPLQDQLSWPAFEGTGYEVTVQVLGEVYTPYGTFDSCYSLMLATNPDTTMDTFCLGMGFVEHAYIHHGTLQEEKFVLSAYTPGQP